MAAFCGSDEAAAHAVIDADDELDAAYAQVEARVVEIIRTGDPSPASLPELLMVAKYFERIGDLAKRIASWAIFRVTGEHVTEKGVDPIPTDD